MFKIEETELYAKTKYALYNYWKEKKIDLQYEFCIHLIQYACGKYYDYNRVNTGKAYNPEALEAYRKTNRTSSKAFQFQRLLFGYRINLTPYITNLSSKEANFKKTPFVKDHIIGTSLIGFYVIYEFKNKLREELNIIKSKKPFEELAMEKYDGNWFEKIYKTAEEFSKDWLEKHLCLWAQCRITSKEHKKDKLVRGWGDVSKQLNEDEKLTILKDRLNLSHYKNPLEEQEAIEIEDYERFRKPKP